MLEPAGHSQESRRRAIRESRVSAEGNQSCTRYSECSRPDTSNASAMRKEPTNEEARALEVINNAASSGWKLVRISVEYAVGQRALVTFVSIRANRRLSRRAAEGWRNAGQDISSKGYTYRAIGNSSTLKRCLFNFKLIKPPGT